jgi:membrane protease subunit HflK
MPWNNQNGGGGQGGGGGPWGSPPPRNPWGSGGGNRGGGGGRGPQPPDIEDLLRKSQERVKQALPGGFGGGRGIAVIGALLALVWLSSGFYRVQPSQLGVELRFGQFTALTEPGLRYHLPAPIESVIRPEVTRVNRLDVGVRDGGDARRGVAGGTSESFMLTSDQNIVNVNFAVIWQISDPVKFLFNIREQEATIKAVAESAMRETMGRTQVDQAITENRGGVEQAVFTRMQQVLDEYQAGVRVVGVQLQAVDPPGPVIDAFNEVQRANADKARLENEANAYKNEIVPRARGESQRLVNEAEAYKAEVVARASGDAQRFLSVLEAYRQSPDVTQQRIYIETMEQVLKNANKIVIDKEVGGSQPVVPYLSLDPMRRPPAASGQ